MTARVRQGMSDLRPCFQLALCQQRAAEQEKFLQRLPKGRLIEPEEVTGIVHLLTSPSARVLHGAVIDASMELGVRLGLISEYSSSHNLTKGYDIILLPKTFFLKVSKNRGLKCSIKNDLRRQTLVLFERCEHSKSIIIHCVTFLF